MIVSQRIILVAFLTVFSCRTIGQTWTTNVFTQLASAATSADGMRVIAFSFITDPQKIYTSTNGGISWTQQSIPFVGAERVVASADGTKLQVSPFNDTVFYRYSSTNFGLTWTGHTNGFYDIACSADGTKLVGGFRYTNGKISLSTNSGSTWEVATNAPGGAWCAVASSADGTRLVAASQSGFGNVAEGVYTSSDSGLTWISNNLPAVSWTSVASSADGAKLIAASAGSGLIYTSTNSGATWTSNNVPNEVWREVVSSADGNTLAVASLFSWVYISTNGGNTWTSNYFAGLVSYENCLAMAADGNKLFVVDTGNGGRGYSYIYTWQRTSTPILSTALSNGNLRLSWLIPSSNFAFEQNSDLRTTNWGSITEAPGLNLTNLEYQLLLSPTNSATFFRLKGL